MLTIIISGAGIAGLTTALSLRTTFPTAKIVLLERSTLSNPEVGAALHIPPNGSRILLWLGFDPNRARVTSVRSSYRVDGSTLIPIEGGRYNENLEKVESTYGAPWWLGLRSDVCGELRRCVEEKGVEIRRGMEVVKFDPETASVTLANGDIIQGDVVIAADGVHSRGMEAVLGRPCPSEKAKVYDLCFRFLIPTAVLEADAVTRRWTENDDGRIKAWILPDKRLVGYPCQLNETQNFVALFRAKGHVGHSSDDLKLSMLETFSDFHPSVVALLHKATEVTQWPLLTRTLLPTWSRASMALLGDAAHPMLPLQGQGGAQAIEDAAALGICLAGASSTDVSARLAVYERVRRSRASVIQILSNAGQDEAHKVREKAAEFIDVDKIPGGPAEFREFNFGYDVIPDALRVMVDDYPGFEPPPGLR